MLPADLLRIADQGAADILDGRYDEAVQAYRHALALDDKCGVKKDIERLERTIKNAHKNTPESGGQKAANPA